MMNPRFVDLSNSGFPGVTFDQATGGFESEIQPGVFLGLYKTPEIAAQVYVNLKKQSEEKGLTPA